MRVGNDRCRLWAGLVLATWMNVVAGDLAGARDAFAAAGKGSGDAAQAGRASECTTALRASWP